MEVKNVRLHQLNENCTLASGIIAQPGMQKERLSNIVRVRRDEPLELVSTSAEPKMGSPGSVARSVRLLSWWKVINPSAGLLNTNSEIVHQKIGDSHRMKVIEVSESC